VGDDDTPGWAAITTGPAQAGVDLANKVKDTGTRWLMMGGAFYWLTKSSGRNRVLPAIALYMAYRWEP